ncbi:MAG: MlaE family ABC transporter permease [Candidatus Binatia bacterium]
MASVAETQRPRGEVHYSSPQPETLCLHLTGSWTLQARRASTSDLERELQTHAAVKRLTFEAGELTAWDSTLLMFLSQVSTVAARTNISCEYANLPQGVQSLLRLTTAVPERQGARRATVKEAWLVRVGKATQAYVAAVPELLRFLGEAVVAFGRLLRGQARFRRADFFLIVQECGAQALPIVSLISFLVGLILAFVGAVQLRQFGAQIYVADLVGIAMAREMGAMMTGIVMAGRTGAAFAAQLGTMMVNEEIDALSTTGLPPMEFLVLPRMLALMIMVPLLCLYADLLGILGGALIGVSMLDLGIVPYFQETQVALSLTTFGLGLIKASVFGVVVALAGCLRGMQSGRSAAAVGEAATSAVVTAIVWIIVTDALLTVIYEVLGV